MSTPAARISAIAVSIVVAATPAHAFRITWQVTLIV